MLLPDIAELVSHTKPMLIVDRVLTANDQSLTAELLIKADSLFCRNGAVAAWVGVEYMAQAIAAHAGYLALLEKRRVQPGMLLGTRNYTCCCASFPVRSILRIHVNRLFLAANGLGSYACTIDNTETELANAVLTVFQPVISKDFIQGQVV
ncbi:MAG: 3-hydroxylacyl-ACP dehydratase [Betaproteobacteria bacterium]|nr:3-hydroxylacyl-ACP dehydratase [Betaproteobacteria bacterium]